MINIEQKPVLYITDNLPCMLPESTTSSLSALADKISIVLMSI